MRYFDALMQYHSQAVLWLSIYVATNLYMKVMGPVNMKKKYNAEWALVTGAGTGQLVSLFPNLLYRHYETMSFKNLITDGNLLIFIGIGKSIAETMALQG